MARRKATHSLSFIRRCLTQFEGLHESGLTYKEIADRFGVPVTLLKQWKHDEDDFLVPDGPWNKVFKGKRWKDMPGSDAFSQRCNFALFRRGAIVEVDGKYVPLRFAKAAREGKKKMGRPRKDGRTKNPPDAEEFDPLYLAVDEDADALNMAHV